MTEHEIAYLIEVLRSHKFDLSTPEYQDFVTNSIFKLKKFQEKENKKPLYIFCKNFSECELKIKEEINGNLLNIEVDFEINIREEFLPPLDPISGCHCKQENDICIKKDLKELFKCKNFKNFVALNPNIKNLFVKEKKFVLIFSPSYLVSCDLYTFKKNVMNLFELIQFQHQVYEQREFNIENVFHRIILIICLFDYLMKNYFFSNIYKLFYVNAFFELNRIQGFGDKNSNILYEQEFLENLEIPINKWFTWLKKACIV